MPNKLELVAELLNPPAAYELASDLNRDEVTVGKTGALFSRAQVREAIDVRGPLRSLNLPREYETRSPSACWGSRGNAA